ncbi:MAG TPA: glycosyltransferase family 39 protein, partial [Polyangiaceae bacterium]|nr:glycosyltransferase family 39 protein [Polyangiaceae bacterium]
MSLRSIFQKWSLRTYLLFVPTFAVAVLVAFTLRHRAYNETFFVYGAYYVLATMLGTCLIVWLSGPGESWSLRAWTAANLPGLVTTTAVSSAVLIAVPAAYRVLADEANLVGVSKNLYATQTANFAVTGKWYFENYWNLNQTIDRRPPLYPFLVSLLHALRGYHAENGFHTNAIILVLFVFATYRLAKSLGGEVFGVAAAILVATNPNTVVAARSAGFDLLGVFLLLVVVLSFHRYVEQPSPRGLALLALSMCLFMHVRVESMGLVAVSLVMLVALRVVRRAHFNGYGLVYALIPV